MTQPIIKKIYVSLDALFDLRQGTLTLIDPDYAIAVTSVPEYFTRDIDLFATNIPAKGSDKPMGPLAREIYEKVFEAKKDEILKNSLMTKMLSFITPLYQQFSKQAILTPFLSSVEIDVNTYPFNLSDDEISTLLACLAEHLGNACTITIINIPIKDLTVGYVKENYLALIMYEYTTWFNEHDKYIRKGLLKEVGLYIPKLFTVRRLTVAEEDEFKKKKTTSFEFTSKMMAPFIVMQFLPTALYSVNLPINLDKYSIIKH